MDCTIAGRATRQWEPPLTRHPSHGDSSSSLLQRNKGAGSKVYSLVLASAIAGLISLEAQTH
jgi:hypothetical protein